MGARGDIGLHLKKKSGFIHLKFTPLVGAARARAAQRVRKSDAHRGRDSDCSANNWLFPRGSQPLAFSFECKGGKRSSDRSSRPAMVNGAWARQSSAVLVQLIESKAQAAYVAACEATPEGTPPPLSGSK